MVYQLESALTESVSALEDKMNAYLLQPCLLLENESMGWLPVFGQAGNIVVEVADCYFICLGIESKILPPSAVKAEIERIVAESGERIESKAQYRQLEEKVMAELLPRALVQRQRIYAYIDQKQRLLVVDASSAKKAALVSAQLRKTLGSFAVVPHSFTTTPLSAIMTYWLQHGLPEGIFQLLEEVEMKALQGEAGVVRIKGVNLAQDEVRNHLNKDWQVSKIAMQYQDELQFVLNSEGILGRLKYLETFEENLHNQEISMADEIYYHQANMHLIVACYRQILHKLSLVCQQNAS